MMSVQVCSGFIGTVVEVDGGLLEWYLLLCTLEHKAN
jgi:hypothetical protein